jgi:hypothetical protein
MTTPSLSLTPRAVNFIQNSPFIRRRSPVDGSLCQRGQTLRLRVNSEDIALLDSLRSSPVMPPWWPAGYDAPADGAAPSRSDVIRVALACLDLVLKGGTALVPGDTGDPDVVPLPPEQLLVPESFVPFYQACALGAGTTLDKWFITALGPSPALSADSPLPSPAPHDLRVPLPVGISPLPFPRAAWEGWCVSCLCAGRTPGRSWAHVLPRPPDTAAAAGSRLAEAG